MIDISKFKIGDTIYEVNEKNNAFLKKKIVKTDHSGIEWFRYDRPDYSYSFNKLVYCGKVIHVISGEVDPTNNYETEYHFKYPDDTIYYEYESLLPHREDLFATQEEAEEYIKLRKELLNSST